jgi:hypothetical protein
MTQTTADPSAPPVYRTWILWGVLLLFLILGTTASAFVVWGLSNALSTGNYLFDGIVVVVSAFGAVVFFLLLSGILYRVDRLRGDLTRKVMLFE